MTAKSYWRGHEIIYDANNRWVYSDGWMSVGGKPRGCGHCGRQRTAEGYDGCLTTLPRVLVMNACCGHGRPGEAYVQFWNGSDIRGAEAIEFFNDRDAGPPPPKYTWENDDE